MSAANVLKENIPATVYAVIGSWKFEGETIVSLWASKEDAEKAANGPQEYAYDDIEVRAFPITSTATPESASAELAELRAYKAETEAILSGYTNVVTKLALYEREWPELRKDKALVDALERRGVQSIYFHNGDQINPASQTLRAAMQQEAKS